MAETLRGTSPVAWGLPSGLSITGFTTILPQSFTYRRDADEATVRNSAGQTVTEIWYDKRESLSIEVVVSGATIAAAKADSILPASGDIITIGDSATPDDAPNLTASNAGKYVCVSAQEVGSNTAERRVSLELRQRTDVDIAVAIT